MFPPVKSKKFQLNELEKRQLPELDAFSFVYRLEQDLLISQQRDK